MSIAAGLRGQASRRESPLPPKARGLPLLPAKPPRITFTRVSWAALALLALVAIVFVSLRTQQQRIAYTDVLAPIFDLLAAVSLLLAAWREGIRDGRRRGLAWGAMGLAMVFYSLGDFSWMSLELILQRAPVPSLNEGLYLAYYPLFLVGVILLSRKSANWAEGVNKILDVSTILAAAVLGYWNLMPHSFLGSGGALPSLQRLILLAYPVGDLVLLGALLFLIFGDSDVRDLRWLHVLTTGIALMILADTIYSYQRLQETYLSGNLLDLGWIAGALAIGAAGTSQWIPGGPAASQVPHLWGGVRTALRFITPYLPYLWLPVAFALLILRALMPLPMSTLAVAVGVGLILVLVLARQFITMWENNRLNRELSLQAASLERANRDLNLEVVERRRTQQKLSHDTLHDGLTGLANRSLFLDRLGQAMERGKRSTGRTLAVLFLDIDHFKVVNDSLGHIVGDQLLILIARRLKETLRSVDTVARFGGDEFTILVEDLKEKQSTRALTDRIQSVMRQPFVLSDRSVHISVSIGVATDIAHYERPEDIVRDADLALYQAKALGKARSEVFAVDMRDRVFQRLELEEDLRRAIERKEFQLHYQPIRSLTSGRIVSVEALLRWMHPSRGVVMPADFLPVAEESGLILPLGDWVLDQACRQMKAWQRRYPPLKDLTISINLSNREFAQPDLARKVAAALKSSRLKGSALRLELTEQVILGSRPTAAAVIADLRKLGVQLQIDDFGIGYSALAYLQQYPIQAIKIDRSFIHRLQSDRRGLGLVRAMVSMAHDLGMDAIAEGIETSAQLKQLKALSCSLGQGYFLCKPLEAPALEKLLARARREIPASTQPRFGKLITNGGRT